MFSTNASHLQVSQHLVMYLIIIPSSLLLPSFSSCGIKFLITRDALDK
jgi:hypothetical protein